MKNLNFIVESAKIQLNANGDKVADWFLKFKFPIITVRINSYPKRRVFLLFNT